MNLAAKLCDRNTFMFISFKKKDFIDSNNEHKHVPPVQCSLVPVHHQVTVRSWFGADGIPGLLFTSLTVAVVFPENTKTFTLAIREAVTQQRAVPDGFRGPVRLCFIWAAPRWSPWIRNSIPWMRRLWGSRSRCPPTRLCQPGLPSPPHTSLQLEWRETFQGTPALSPHMGRCSRIPNC